MSEGASRHAKLSRLGPRGGVGPIASHRAPISAIHYSKNIPLTDYSTCSMAISDLQRIDLTKRLDLSRTDYRNEGHAIRYHANRFEVIFYDKLTQGWHPVGQPDTAHPHEPVLFRRDADQGRALSAQLPAADQQATVRPL